VTVTYRTEAEVRAFVKNGEGILYHVNLAESGAYCSCPDATQRRVVCKHVVALAITCLQQAETLANPVHFWLRTDPVPLCGEQQARRFTQHWLESVSTWPDVCPRCLQVWRHPIKRLSVTKDEFFFSPAKEQEHYAMS
jgi:hypothetical protein